MSTQNAGNEALSVSLLEFLARHDGVSEVRALDRYPRRLESIQFPREQDPQAVVARFEAEVSRLEAPTSAEPLAPVAARSLVRLDKAGQDLPQGIRKLKRMMGVRRNLARFGLLERGELQATLNTIAWSDLVVWNPAGEYHPTGGVDHPYRLLMLVRLAQRLGKRTAVVNHSLELADARLAAVVRCVYGDASVIIVRDKPSVDAARDIGVPSDRLIEAPDLVFLSASAPDHGETAANGPIGLAINGLQALAGHDEWPELMDGLGRLGRPLCFVSNAMNHDAPFARSLARFGPIEIIPGQPTHEELRDIFSKFSALISSRLHSSILAIGAGAPVVSIEPQVFKVKALFEQMAYPLATESLRSPGWAQRTLANIRRAIAERSEIGQFGLAAVSRQVAHIEAAYEPLFRQ